MSLIRLQCTLLRCQGCPLTVTVLQLWQIRITLPETRILLRCSSPTWQDAGRSIRLPGGLQWVLRIQVRRDLPRRTELHLHAPLQLDIRSPLRTSRLLHCARAKFQETSCMARDADGAVRELIRNDLEIYFAGLDAAILYVHYDAMLGKIPPIAT